MRILGSCTCKVFGEISSRWGHLPKVHIEDEAGIWDGYDNAGEPIRGALIKPSITTLKEAEVSQADLLKREARRDRIRALREKRARGEALSPSEAQEVLDLLLGV